MLVKPCAPDQKAVTTDVHDCARCASDHLALTFQRFRARPITEGKIEWAYWAACPTNGEPILLTAQAAASAQLGVR